MHLRPGLLEEEPLPDFGRDLPAFRGFQEGRYKQTETCPVKVTESSGLTICFRRVRRTDRQPATEPPINESSGDHAALHQRGASQKEVSRVGGDIEGKGLRTLWRDGKPSRYGNQKKEMNREQRNEMNRMYILYRNLKI